jgi:hypothetical protein
MNDQIESLFAFLQSEKVKKKYELYRNGGGVANSSYQPKCGTGFRITDDERNTIKKKYNSMVPIFSIAEEIGRSPDSVRNVLKKAGLYDKNREVLQGQMKGYTKTKTVRVEIK